MKSWKRALPFILLNVLVSAVATLVVLIWWNSTHNLNLPEPISIPTAAPVQQPTPTLPALETPVIEINSVIGAGDLENEVVVLRLVSPDGLLLEGWKIQGSGGSIYTFPNLLLKSGEIQLFTGGKPAGRPDSANEIFWGRNTASWRSGETLTLYDPIDGARATFRIP